MALKVKAVQTDLNHLTDAKGNKLGMRFLLKPYDKSSIVI